MKKILLSIVAIAAFSLGVMAQWDEQATGFSAQSRGIRCITAVDANVVWAGAYDGSGGGAACQDYTKTLNGGTLWTPATVPGVANLEIANIAALSDQLAWLCMYPPASPVTGQGIYKTTDGGATWTRQASALFTNSSSFSNFVYFWDSNLGVCMGDPISGEFEIYTTQDGGTTWVAVPGADIPNPVSGEFGVIGYFSVVGDNIWFGTNKGRIYRSADNGLTWNVSAISGWGSKYVQPFFRDAMNGLAVDKSTSNTTFVAATTDGGVTWTPVTSTGNIFTNDFAYVEGSPSTYVSTGAATGFTGVTYSFDEGVTWNDMAATIGTQYLATTWVNDSTAWAGGFNTDNTTGGMFKFNSILKECDFTSDLTSIVKGGTVVYTITQGAHSTSAVQWTFPGGTPGTSTNRHPSVVYNTPGTYNVTLKVTNSWGVTTETKTGLIYVGGVGINEQSAATVSVYPNPVKGMLHIDGSMAIKEVKIMNMVGQTVYSQESDAANLNVNTAGLKSGVYSLQLKMADGFITKKIVVN